MLILMKADATPAEINGVCDRIRELGFKPHEIPGQTRVAIGITGNQGSLDPALFERLPAVAEAVAVSRPWKLVSREVKPDDTVIEVPGPASGPVRIGGGTLTVMAGPCAVESREQLFAAAGAVRAAGAHILRGGAFKPRTSPYAFQGLKDDGLSLLSDARAANGGMPVITEVVDTRDVARVAEKADILQIGARNMQNFALLEAVGEQRKPVMLKRGMSATISEWLMAAEYILARGNYNVMLCERGVRTFETMTRNTLDLGCLPTVRRLTHLPIIVDPSHGTGDYRSVPALARAAVAGGADGIMVEVHPDPARALSDGPQSLTPQNFAKLMESVKAIAEVVGLRLL
jgi:3-deoxy-7-phosphoheptulonate synthase